MTTSAKELEVFKGPFDSAKVRKINNAITKRFNDYTKKHETKTIAVIVQTKDGKQKQNWCTVGRTKPESISFIGLYEMEQTVTLI